MVRNKRNKLDDQFEKCYYTLSETRINNLQIHMGYNALRVHVGGTRVHRVHY